MHALESIELVTMLSQPTVELVSSDELTPRFTNSFWGASKCREQRWKLELSKLAPRLKDAQKPDESWAQYAQLVVISRPSWGVKTMGERNTTSGARMASSPPSRSPRRCRSHCCMHRWIGSVSCVVVVSVTVVSTCW